MERTHEEIYEDFREQYDRYYAEPCNRETKAFYKYAEGIMTEKECDEAMQQYACDMNSWTDREGFCE